MTSKNSLAAFLLGLVIGGAAVYVGTIDTHYDGDGHAHDDKHPVGYADSADEVHVHSDFLMVLNGEQIDFTADKYQTTSEQELAEHVHLHDNVGNVIHRHAQTVTLGEFFGSLGFTLTNDCLTTDDSVQLCTGDASKLLVFVNDERIDNPSEYTNKEEDRILIYYGDPNNNELIRESLLTITDEACIYSGTCPERGIAPPESCGLTCDI